jgi:hypothetical protein
MTRLYDLKGKNAEKIQNASLYGKAGEERPLTRDQRRQLKRMQENQQKKIVKKQKTIAKKLGFSNWED